MASNKIAQQQMLHGALKMATITNILEEVIIDDEYAKPLTRDVFKTFSLSKVISKNKASLSDITYWQWKISEYIYMLYLKGIGCSTDIDLTKVMIDKDRRLVETSIVNAWWTIDERSDARIINAILNLHMSISKLINTKYYSTKEYNNFNMLRIFGNYFYAGAVSDMESKVAILQLIRYSEQMHRMTCLGLFNELNAAMNIK